MQQLQLDVKRQASTYAETVKRGSDPKHKQHAEHVPYEPSAKGTDSEEKKNSNGESNATPASLASPDESPNAHNTFRQRDKIPVAGSRKIWGTLKSTTTSAVSNAVCSLTGMNADHLIFKRKYITRPTQPKIQANGGLSFEVMRPYLKIWRKSGT